ncbi:MAG: protein-L-isoaspartate O-methyltransferase [Bacteroidetes bacterium]|jgi:protein-L-isoaspartate(D-aspartate) O-methyltransferase|nr:protein-L-isoaspartate O-methyltransferase [Bacteroidota bacterium]|tara:strand:- start:352 stop:1053 length:702 start_codon:yes stop_codon:yes gene_type:complete
MKTRTILFILITLNIGILFPVLGQDAYEKERIHMVNQQIKSRGIYDKNTLNAMKTVKRHLFVLPGYRNSAYEDRPLPIGYGQTISQPYIVAYMTELLNVGQGDTVLEIGTGSGYQAAILAEFVKQVYTIEIVEELYISAKKRLKTLNYNNVEVKGDDGYYGWEEHGPFDGIVVTAAAEYVPPPLIEQLKDGGKMIIPVGSPFGVQTLMMITKKGGKVKTSRLIPVRFVPFTRN